MDPKAVQNPPSDMAVRYLLQMVRGMANSPLLEMFADDPKFGGQEPNSGFEKSVRDAAPLDAQQRAVSAVFPYRSFLYGPSAYGSFGPESGKVYLPEAPVESQGVARPSSGRTTSLKQYGDWIKMSDLTVGAGDDTPPSVPRRKRPVWVDV